MEDEDEETLRKNIEILENGYEYDFQSLPPSSMSEPLSKESCLEARDILRMFRNLRNSYNELSEKDGISAEDIKFKGYDFNHPQEGLYAGYTKFMIDYREWPESRLDDYNSHNENLGRYRRMLAKLEEFPHEKKYHLTSSEIAQILEAKREY